MDIMNPQDGGITDGKGPELCILEEYPDIYLTIFLHKSMLLILIEDSFIDQF